MDWPGGCTYWGRQTFIRYVTFVQVWAGLPLKGRENGRSPSVHCLAYALCGMVCTCYELRQRQGSGRTHMYVDHSPDAILSQASTHTLGICNQVLVSGL